MMKKDHLSKSVDNCLLRANFSYHIEKVSNWKHLEKMYFNILR